MAEDNNTQSDQTEVTPSDQKAPPAAIKFGLQRVYLKDLSFESPLGVEAFQQKSWNPKINQDLNTTINKVAEELFEVVLKLTINVEEDGKTVFLIEVQQAGLFAIGNVEPQQLAHILNTKCPEVLFPYAREAIDACAVRGGFPAVMIPPVNFDVLFMQAVQQAQQKAQAAQAEKDATNATTN